MLTFTYAQCVILRLTSESLSTTLVAVRLATTTFLLQTIFVNSVITLAMTAIQAASALSVILGIREFTILQLCCVLVQLVTTMTELTNPVLIVPTIV